MARGDIGQLKSDGYGNDLRQSRLSLPVAQNPLLLSTFIAGYNCFLSQYSDRK